VNAAIYPGISDVPLPIDTVTMYLSAAKLTPLIEDIIKARPRRIIFNPGSENDELAKAAESAGIEVVNGCTLVMLGAGTF
jgi:predicted CoA-binding protein